jgi:hypothetical protein
VGVNPETGSHRDIGAYLSPPVAQQALALETANSAIVLLDGALLRVDLNSGQTATIASNELLRNASGVTRLPSGDILVTVIPDKILRVSPADGSTVLLAAGGLLWHPRAPTVLRMQGAFSLEQQPVQAGGWLGCSGLTSRAARKNSLRRARLSR